MPSPDRQNSDPSFEHSHSQDTPTQETLFLLSICRDDDDAAALRADLRRSSLKRHKLQHCANIDDAQHLLQVCGFDLVFLRLDDFQDRQAAVNLVRRSDKDLSLIALASGRLLASPDFEMPSGIDATCRLEDLSPSLIASLVSSVIDRKTGSKDRERLSDELNFAVDTGGLGRWALDIETGRLELSQKAAAQLGLDHPSRQNLFLDDLLDRCIEEDQYQLKRTFELAIESGDELQATLRIQDSDNNTRAIVLRAKHRPGGHNQNASLFGYLKSESHSSEDLRQQLQDANDAIRKALAKRDDAIKAANAELELLLDKLNLIENADASATSLPEPKLSEAPDFPVVTLAAPDLSPAETLSESLSEIVEETTAVTPNETETPAEPETADSSIQNPDTDQTSSLTVDKQTAFQSVLKSITRQQKQQDQNTFPFDFSATAATDYSEPNPHAEGFVGAAKRLVSITQNGHKLRVSLSIDNDGAIELERESDLLFEILRELLTNVVKHSRATECIIAIFRDEDDWVLQVEDDGVGLENNLVSISTPLNQIGLFRIRTKLALKGGQLDLTPTQPRGLIARARLPVNLSSRGAERA